MGNLFANFLLGDATATTQYAPLDARMGKSQWAVFIQDSWKVTLMLTLDYGLRWDHSNTNQEEQYGHVIRRLLGGTVTRSGRRRTSRRADHQQTWQIAAFHEGIIRMRIGPRLVATATSNRSLKPCSRELGDCLSSPPISTTVLCPTDVSTVSRQRMRS